MVAELLHGPVGGVALGHVLGPGMIDQPLGEARRQHQLAVRHGDEAVAKGMEPEPRAARLADACVRSRAPPRRPRPCRTRRPTPPRAQSAQARTPRPAAGHREPQPGAAPIDARRAAYRAPRASARRLYLQLAPQARRVVGPVTLLRGAAVLRVLQLLEPVDHPRASFPCRRRLAQRLAVEHGRYPRRVSPTIFSNALRSCCDVPPWADTGTWRPVQL